MTGIEIILLLAGCIFMVGSFFIAEKLSPSELKQIAELSEGELQKIIDKGLKNAVPRVDEAIEKRIEMVSDKVDRALEKETNEKIMAISEYSDTVIQDMNKSHNEIMFLYSMLNDKHSEMTGMASDLQHLASDIRNLQERIRAGGGPDGCGRRNAGEKNLPQRRRSRCRRRNLRQQYRQNLPVRRRRHLFSERTITMRRSWFCTGTGTARWRSRESSGWALVR